MRKLSLSRGAIRKGVAHEHLVLRFEPLEDLGFCIELPFPVAHRQVDGNHPPGEDAR